MSFSNREILYELINSVQGIITEKTNNGYGQVAVLTLIQKLGGKFPFLNNISFDSDSWKISSEIENIPKKDLCKAVEAIIRIVYMDLQNEAGLFFLSEIEARAKPGFINELRDNGTDIDLLKIEHHVLFRNLNRLKLEYNDCSNLEDKSKEISKVENEHLINLEEIEKELLILLKTSNISQDGVLKTLDISLDEMNLMLSRLIQFQLLQYVTNDEIELTKKGHNYVYNLNNKSLNILKQT